jgi:hypothetical protein
MKRPAEWFVQAVAVLSLVAGAAGQARSDTVWNAAADYDAGYAAGTNPNGAWTYGWTSSLTSGLNVYTSHGLIPPGPNFESWYDPREYASLTPMVYKNAGSEYSDGNNVDIPASALILHGGGPSGNDYSDVVWTAPYSGTFSLAATFTGRQTSAPPGDYQTNAYVLENGMTLFSTYLNSEGDSGTFSGVLSLTAGDTIVFALGIQGTGLHGESTQLDAIITTTSVPEPCSLTLLALGAVGFIAYDSQRRKQPA